MNRNNVEFVPHLIDSLVHAHPSRRANQKDVTKTRLHGGCDEISLCVSFHHFLSERDIIEEFKVENEREKDEKKVLLFFLIIQFTSSRAPAESPLLLLPSVIRSAPKLNSEQAK